jgi:hypothetical protein
MRMRVLSPRYVCSVNPALGTVRCSFTPFDLLAQHDWTLFIRLFRGNLHEISDQTSAILIIRIIADMLWFGLLIHAGPDRSAGFRMELSCVPVVAMVDTDGAAFTDAG